MLKILNNKYISALSLLICTLLIFSGQLTVNRIVPLSGFLGGIRINFIIIIVLIIITLIFYGDYNNKDRGNFFRLIKITAVIILANIFISLIEKREINIGFNFDITSMAITGIFIFILIKNKRDFIIFMRIVAMTAIILGLTNYFLWNFDRFILLTEISSNRIILFGLGAATLLFIDNLKLENFLLVVVLIFLATCGSLKIGFLAFCLFIFLSITMLIVCEKFKTAKLLILAITFGVYFGYINNNFQDIQSRINLIVDKELVSQQKDPPKGLPGKPDNIEDYLVLECLKSINYDYCISDKITIRDSTERMRMWLHALNIIRSNPFFGVGVDGYNLRMVYRYPSGNKIIDYKYPHNIFLNLAVEFGLPFTLLIGVIIYLCFVLAIRVSISNPEIIGLVAAGAAIFLASNTGGDLYDARYIFLIYVLASLYSNAPNYQHVKSDLVKL